MTRPKAIADWPRTWRGLLSTALAAAGLLAALPAVADAAEAGAEAGRQVFQDNCAACHTLGGGDLVGPDLKGVTARRSRDWLQRWIAAPDEMLARNDPIATELLHRFNDVPMPNQQLSASDIAAVLAYLEAAAPIPAAQRPAPAASGATVGGDPAMGKDLFTGVRRFRNGGPSCMSCHSVAGIGALGGGQLGPDLTTVVTRFGGPVAIGAFIGGSPTPTMNAVWAQHPLRADERADVVAFLAEAAASQRAPQAIWQLAGLAVLGMAILLAGAGWIWRGRLREVRRPMIARQRRARPGGPADIRRAR